MAAELKCSNSCGFDLARFPGRRSVLPEDGSVVMICCPLCGSQLEIHLQSLGVLVRGSGVRTEFFRWKLSGGQAPVSANVISIGSFQLRFDALGVIEPRDICYAHVPAFTSEDGGQVVPALPVRREFFDCIDLGAFARLSQAGRRADIVGGEYQVALPLHGLDKEVELRLPLVAHRPPGAAEQRTFSGVSLRIWPNLDLLEWRHYLVGLVAAAAPGGEALLGPSPRVRLHARGASAKNWGSAFGSSQRAGDSIVGVFDERPSWVALEITEPGKATDGEAVGGGIFHLPAAQGSAPKASSVELGLDFGTSNTCVAIGTGDLVEYTGQPHLVPRVSDERDWNIYLVRGGPEQRAHAGPDLWPSPHGFGRYADLYPSELLFVRSKTDQVRFLERIADWRYGCDFGIPAALVEPGFAESEHILGEFKWRDRLLESAPAFAQEVEWLQAHYIAAVLMNVYVRAAVIAKRTARTVSVRFSYPVSFSEWDWNALDVASKHAAALLNRLTGLEWTLSYGADESAAAAANAGDPGARIAVYLDMGGGSTDIAVKIEQHQRWETVYLTSIRYAGMGLLDAYKGEASSSSCLAGKTTIDALSRRVREATHVNQVLGDPLLFNKHQEGVAQNRTLHFYGYLTEYIARLLAAGFLDQRFKVEETPGTSVFPRECSIVVYFLGNGWRFDGWLNTEYQKALANKIFQRMLELVMEEKTTGEYADEIRAALKGIRVAKKEGKLGDVPHEKAAVAMGLLNPTANKSKRKPSEGARIASILGWSTRVDGRREVPWFAMYEKGLKPPAPSADTSESEFTFGAEGSGGTKLATPWYESFSNPSLDWQNSAPLIPMSLEQPFELDENLNLTRGHLKRLCIGPGSEWFVKAPYEVMLEELFRKALKTIGG